MRKVILIEDDGRQIDITEAVRERMGDMFNQNHRSAQPTHQQHRHMHGIENAQPLPHGMRPEDFAGDENVRFIPVPAPMPGMNREVYGVPMNQRPMMGQNRMPNFQHQQMQQDMRHMPNHQHRNMFNGGMPFNRPIPSPAMFNPYYQTYDGNGMFDEE